MNDSDETPDEHAPQPDTRPGCGRWPLFVVTILVGVVIGGIAGLKSKAPLYTSVAFIHVDPVVQDPMAKRDEVMVRYENFVNTHVARILMDRVVLRAMEGELWRSTGRASIEDDDAVVEFGESLIAFHDRTTEYITVSFSEETPAIAQRGVRAVIEAYEELYGSADLSDIASKLGVLNGQREKVLGNLRSVQRNVEAVASTFGGPANLKSRYNSKYQDLEQLEKTLRDLRMEMDRQKQVETQMEGESDDPSNAGVLALATAQAENDPGMQGLLRQREDLVSFLGDAESKFGPLHPSVKEARRTLQSFEMQIQQRVYGSDMAPGGVADVLGLDMSIQIDQLIPVIQETREEVASLGQKQVKVLEYEREIILLQDQLKNYDIRRSDLEMQQIVSGHIRIDERGTLPREASSDPRSKLALFGGFLGGCLGVALVLLRGFLDRRMHDSADAQLSMAKTRMLGVLPHLPEDLSEPEQAGIAAHCVHHIRALMQLALEGRMPQVYAITSPAPEDGKTSMALATGLSFAAADHNTLLIDCDLSGGGLTERTNAILRRKIGQILLRDGLVSAAQLEEALRMAEDTPNARLGETLINLGHISESDLNSALSLQEHASIGLLDCMAGEDLDDCVFATGITGLSVLPVGSARAIHSAKLSPSGIKRVLDEARKKFEVVIVDTGPVQGSLEASIVSPLADGVVFVVSRGNDRPAAERALGHLDQIGAHVVGVVFNRAAESEVRAISYAPRSTETTDDGSEDRPVRERRMREPQSAARFGPIARAVASYENSSDDEADQAKAE